MAHRKDFSWLVLEKLGKNSAKAVDWSGPRLTCVAGDFSTVDLEITIQSADDIEKAKAFLDKSYEGA